MKMGNVKNRYVVQFSRTQWNISRFTFSKRNVQK